MPATTKDPVLRDLQDHLLREEAADRRDADIAAKAEEALRGYLEEPTAELIAEALREGDQQLAATAADAFQKRDALEFLVICRVLYRRYWRKHEADRIENHYQEEDC